MSTYIYKDDQQQGPYDDEYIEMCLNKGKLSYDDHCWKEGWEEWKPLAAAFTRPIPPPPTKAPPATPQPSTTSSAKSEISASDKTEEKISSPIQELRKEIDLIFKLHPSFRRALKGDMIDGITASNIFKTFKNISEPKDQILFSYMLPCSLLGINLPFPTAGIIITDKNVYVKGFSIILFVKYFVIPLNLIKEYTAGGFYGRFTINKKNSLYFEPNPLYVIDDKDAVIIASILDEICRMNRKNS